MSFNPDLTNQAQQILFSSKTRKLLHSTLLFNNIQLRSIRETSWFNIGDKVKLFITQNVLTKNYKKP